MTMTQISVIIPTRDRWMLLGCAARTALSQTDVAVELIVIDDGSSSPPPPDPIWSDPRVRLIRHERTQGHFAARNTGNEAARGQWLAWLDDDDLWAPFKLSRQLAEATTGGATLVYSSAVAVDRYLRPLEYWPAPPADGLARALVADALIPAGSSNVLANREAVLMCGGFDTSFAHLGDWDMWLRLARKGPARRCEETLVAYVMHGGNMHLRGEGLMDEFDRLAVKHAAWAEAANTRFHRIGFSHYPIRGLVQQRRYLKAVALAADCCLRPPTRASVRVAASALAGARVAAGYRRLRSGPPPPPPPWLGELRAATLVSSSSHSR